MILFMKHVEHVHRMLQNLISNFNYYYFLLKAQKKEVCKIFDEINS